MQRKVDVKTCVSFGNALVAANGRSHGVAGPAANDNLPWHAPEIAPKDRHVEDPYQALLTVLGLG